MNTLGQELKKLRGIKEWSQSKAAEEIGIEQSYLSKLESDQSWASLDILKRICRMYGVRPAQLLSQVNAESLSGNIQYQGFLLRAKQRRNIILLGSALLVAIFLIWYAATKSWISVPGLQPIKPKHESITLQLEQIGARDALELLASFATLQVEGADLMINKTVDIDIVNQPWDKATTEFVQEQGLKVKIAGGKITIYR